MALVGLGVNRAGVPALVGCSARGVNKLHAELEVLLKSAETKKRLESEGADIVRMDPAEFGRFMSAEMVKWTKVVREAGITAE